MSFLCNNCLLLTYKYITTFQPVYVEPTSVQQVSASSSEGQATGMPEYQFAPVGASVVPDVVILYDTQDEPSDASGSGAELDDTRASVQANDVLLATPHVEPKHPTIGERQLLF
jgi:hypothetical protein